MTDIIKQAQEAYDAGNPIMSDEAFDNLTDSESQFELTEDTYTVKHEQYMGSMPKVHSFDELAKIAKDGDYVQPKFDGISCEIVIENSNIKTISTRGNGSYGKDLSNLLDAGFLKNSIWSSNLTLVYGELVLFSDNPTQKDRNVVAGLCNRNDLSIEDVENLRLIVFRAYRGELIVGAQELESMFFCNSLSVRPSITKVAYEINEEVIENIKDYFDDYYCNIKRDGIVFKSNRHHHEFALKPEPKSAITEIVDVSWTKGKSKFSSTAIISPIVIDGVTISRVTLPERYIREMDLAIGDIIEVTRAGDVIPRIVDKVADGEYRKGIEPPVNCQCGGEYITVGKKLTCSNPDCEYNVKSLLYKVVEVLFWGIKRAPKSKLNKMVSDGSLTLDNILDINTFNSLTQRQKELISQGIERNFRSDNIAKSFYFMNIDGLTYEVALDLQKDVDSIDNSKYYNSINFILKSKQIKQFTEKFVDLQDGY